MLGLGSQLHVVELSLKDPRVLFLVQHELVIERDIHLQRSWVEWIGVKRIPTCLQTSPQNQSLALQKTDAVQCEPCIHETKTADDAVEIPPKCIDQLHWGEDVDLLEAVNVVNRQLQDLGAEHLQLVDRSSRGLHVERHCLGGWSRED